MLDPYDTNTAHTIEAQRSAQDQYLALILLCVAECGRTYRQILQELRNDALKGQSMFPAMISKELVMVNDYSAMAPKTQTTSGYKGVAFAQEEAGSTTFTKIQLKEASAGGAPK